MAYALVGFCTSFDVVVEEIRALNEDATIVTVSIQNLMEGLYATIPGVDVKIPFGDLFGSLINAANFYTAAVTSHRDEYFYADVRKDGHVEFFMDELAAYSGDPTTLGQDMKDCFDVYDDDLYIQTRVQQFFVEQLDRMGHVQFPNIDVNALEKNWRKDLETFATLRMYEYIYVGGMTLQNFLEAGAEGLLPDAFKPYYAQYEVALTTAYDVMAEIMQEGILIDTLDAGSFGQKFGPVEDALLGAFFGTLEAAVGASISDPTYSFSLEDVYPNGLFETLSAQAGLDEAFVKTVAVMGIRTGIGNSFYGHPNAAGHEEIFNIIMDTLKNKTSGTEVAQEEVERLLNELGALIEEYAPEAWEALVEYAEENEWDAKVTAAAEELQKELKALYENEVLPELEAVLAELEEMLEELEAELKAAEAELEAKLEELEAKLEELEAKLEAKYNELKNATEELKAEIEAAIAEIEAAIAEIKAAIEGVKEAIVSLEEKITDLKAYAEDVAKAVEELLEAIENAKEEAIGEAIDKVQEALTNLGKVIGFIENEIAKINGVVDAIQAKIDAVVAELEELAEEVKAEIARIKAEIEAAIEEIQAKIEAAIEELKNAAEEAEKQLKAAYEELLEKAAEVQAELEVIAAEAEAVLNEVLAEAEVVAEKVLAEAEIAADKLIAEAEKAYGSLEEAYQNAVYSEFITTPETYYVAIGDESVEAVKYKNSNKDVTVEFDSYADRLAEALEINFDTELVMEEGMASELPAFIAANAEEIAKADLITVGLSHNVIMEYVVNQVAGSMIPGAGEAEGIDWTVYAGEEGAAQIEKLFGELEAYLVKENAETGAFLAAALESYAYAGATYGLYYAEAINAIHAINSEALVIVVGMYNVFEDLVIPMEGAEIALGEYIGYAVDAMNYYATAYAMLTANTIYVDAPEVETSVDENGDLMEAMTNFIFNQIDFRANENGHEYIKEQILGALGVTDYELGDVNMDGRINIGDVDKLYRYVMGYVEVDEIQLEVADVTQDGRVNIGDVDKLYRYVMGYIETLG